MKRLLLALVFGTCAYTVAFASAATIGTVTDAGVGSGSTVIAIPAGNAGQVFVVNGSRILGTCGARTGSGGPNETNGSRISRYAPIART